MRASLPPLPLGPADGRLTAREWTAQVNGTPALCLPANVWMRAVPVSAGGSEVVAFRESADGVSDTVLWRTDADRKRLSLTVPSGQVFVLGDNRDAALDSRDFGVLPLADVTAVARQVWFSFDREDGVRLRRTGKLLD